MIKELLVQKKIAIVGKWIQSILSTYPSEASGFLHLQKDRFKNPVGHIISANAEKIFDEIAGGYNTERIKLLLDDIIKVRAVQDFSPSQAVGFIFSLKQVIYSELEYNIKNEKISEELMAIEHRIDQTALAAFDLYTEAREKIYQIKLREVKSKLQYKQMMDVK